MFLDWAAKNSKAYESAEERKFRFKIWCSAKKMLENAFSMNNPGYTFSINNMSWIADRTLPEQSKMSGSCFIGEDPFKGPPPLRVVKYVKSLGEEGVKKAWKEFDEWAERQKRDYGSSSEERTLRFHAYVENKRKIDELEKKFPGFWRHGYDLDNMDKFVWEASLAPKFEVAGCSHCGL